MSDETASLLGLIADIRAAVGDPEGKLMQDELVEHCRKLREERDWLRDLVKTTPAKILVPPDNEDMNAPS